MFKKIIIALMAIAFVSGSLGMSFAADQGNKRKGKYLYRKVYKSCNERGEVEATKPLLNPDAHTQAEWTEMFENKQFAEFKCAEEWGNLTDKELTDIYTYLHAHAFDSPTPAKCK